MAPELAAEIVAVRDSLGEPGTEPDHRHTQRRRWERTIGEIRRLPGFEGFLRVPRPEALRALVPQEGTVVTVNVSKHRCDALMLDRCGLRTVPLPGLRYDDLDRRSQEFGAAVAAAENPRLRLVDRLDAQVTVRETLGWLWDNVAAPVLSALGHTGPPPESGPWPRLWWSPTGALSTLPLHAAGHLDMEEEVAHGNTVLDRVVSSYTPTIRALPTGLATGRTGPPLVVAIPDTPGHAPLPSTLVEATELGTAAGARLLVGGRATRAAVADALPSSGWVHFACHAYQDPANPSGSHLVLHDQPLMITDLHRLRAAHAQLAYLSACSTARSTGVFASESAHLGTAFRLVGFRHVIATLWQVHDQTAAEIARAFYVRYGTAHAALALHTAVREARDADPMLATRWAAHVHTGP